MTEENNFSKILKNNLKTYNANHSIELEYDTDQGGTQKYLKVVGDDSHKIKCSMSQAIDIVNLIDHVGVRTKWSNEKN
jgi:hypothetical protein